jgi:hypothetical protein
VAFRIITNSVMTLRITTLSIVILLQPA